MLGTVPDLLRLVAVPVLGWAAWRDVRTRRVPNRTWLPLAGLGLVLLLVEGWRVWHGTTATFVSADMYFLRVGISLGFVIPLSYAFWWMGGFGGADAKALIALAILFPTFPTYYLSDLALPVVVPTLGVFSLSVLSNTVVAGLCYPVVLTLQNAVGGHVSKAMVIGRPISWDEAPVEYGRLLETPEGFTRRGLDLDALRMYLAWRGTTLAALRDAPAAHRDPASLPADPNPPGDGAIPVADGGEPADVNVSRSGDATATADADEEMKSASEQTAEYDDPWGAEAFLDDIDGNAYGTDPEDLRAGLSVLTTADEVWISPGIPFLVPMFVGLLLGLLYGDVLFAAIAGLGLF